MKSLLITAVTASFLLTGCGQSLKVLPVEGKTFKFSIVEIKAVQGDATVEECPNASPAGEQEECETLDGGIASEQFTGFLKSVFDGIKELIGSIGLFG